MSKSHEERVQEMNRKFDTMQNEIMEKFHNKDMPGYLRIAPSLADLVNTKPKASN